MLKFTTWIMLLSFIVSCKKSDTSVPACKAVKIHDGRSGLDFTYTYSGNQVTKAEFSGGYYKYEYNSNKPSRRNVFYGAAVDPYEHHDFFYNGDGSLDRIEFYELINYQNNLYNIYARLNFSYAGGSVNNMKVYTWTQGVSTLEAEYTYTADGSGNLVTCRAIDYLPTVQQADFSFIYDGIPNYFRKNSSYALLLDATFDDLNPLLLPMAFSNNNLTRISNSSSNTNINYTEDANGNLNQFTIGTNILSKYTYLCN